MNERVSNATPEPFPDSSPVFRNPAAPYEGASPQTYAEAYPEADKMFAWDLGLTQHDGDAFDVRKSLRTKNIMMQAAIPAAVATELGAAGGSVVPFAGAVLGIGAISWHRSRQDRQGFKSQSRRLEAVGAHVGQHYELYREASITDKSKDAPVTVIWHEPSKQAKDSFGPLESLRQMAELSQRHGVQAMHISASQYRSICRGYNIPDTRVSNRVQLLLNKKDVAISKGDQSTNLVPGTPESWLAFVAEVESESYDVGAQLTFPQVVEKMRKLDQDSALLAVVDQYEGKAVSEEQRQRYRKEIDSIVNIRLFRQESYPERGREFKVQGRPFYPHEITDTEDGFVARDAKHVMWRTRRNGYKVQETVNVFGLTNDEYERLISADVEIDDKDLDIKKLVAAMEVAIVRHVHDQPVSAAPDNKQKVHVARASAMGYTIQEVLSNGKDKRMHVIPHRLRQGAAGIGLVMALQTVIHPVHNAVDTKETQAMEYSRVQVANARKVDPSLVSDVDAQKYLDSRSPWWDAWHNYTTVEDAINPDWDTIKDLFSDTDAGAAVAASSSGTTSQVGNTNLPDNPDYTITSHGGANSEGFWEASTSQTLVVKKPSETIGTGFTLTWVQEDRNNNGSTSLDIPTELPKDLKSGPSLEVHRNLNNNDFFYLEDGDEADSAINRAVNLPVLENMKPVAASVDDKPVKLVSRRDGTYGITSSTGDAVTGDLEYWLAPDAGRKVKNPGTLLALGVLNGDKYTMYYDKDLDAVPELGEAGKHHRQLLEVFSHGSKKEQENARAFAKSYEKTIRDTWRYSTSPFKRDAEDSWWSLDDFQNAAHDVKKDNCNVANTLVGLQDIESAQVMGYQNGVGSGNMVLSTNEAHQKRTNGDATSVVRAAELPPSKPFRLPISPGIMALAGAGLIVASQQRRIRRGLRAAAAAPGRKLRAQARLRDEQLQSAYQDQRDTEQQAREIALQQIPEERVARAIATVQRLLYAPRVSLFDIKEDVPRILAESTRPVSILLDHPEYATPSTVASLEAHAESIHPRNFRLAEEIYRSTAVLRQADRVLQDRASEPEIMVSGLTRTLGRIAERTASLRRRITPKQS